MLHGDRINAVIFIHNSIDYIWSAAREESGKPIVSTRKKRGFVETAGVFETCKKHRLSFACGCGLRCDKPADDIDIFVAIIAEMMRGHTSFRFFPWLVEVEWVRADSDVEKLHFPYELLLQRVFAQPRHFRNSQDFRADQIRSPATTECGGKNRFEQPQ